MGPNLLLCEGSSELYVVAVLLGRGLLRWKRQDLLFGAPVAYRQFNPVIEGALKAVGGGEKVSVFRIGDKLGDELKKTSDREAAEKLAWPPIKVLTKPELEVLFLIFEDRYSDYLKWKKGRHPDGPSDYYKTLHNEYHKDRKYILSFFQSLSDVEIIRMLKAYKERRFGAHEKDELCLYDLLREDLKK